MLLANFLIALREGVEAALLVGILVAYVIKVGRRDLLPKLWVGVSLAAIIPLAAGAAMTWGTYSLTFQAQEIIGGTLSIIAAGFVTWMLLWISIRSHEIVDHLHTQAERALHQNRGIAFVWIAVLAVGREGIETSIFVMGTIKNSSQAEPVIGILLGILCSIVIGWIIYTGATRFNLKRFFSVTGILLLFVAAGIFSYGISDLQEAGVLPGWGITAYDFSPYFDQGGFLATNSWWYVLLEAMFNLNIQPTVLQTIGWLAYMAIAAPLFIYTQFVRPRKLRLQRANIANGSEEIESARISLQTETKETR